MLYKSGVVFVSVVLWAAILVVSVAIIAAVSKEAKGAELILSINHTVSGYDDTFSGVDNDGKENPRQQTVLGFKLNQKLNDYFDVYFLHMSRSYRGDYGFNMLGVSYTINLNDLFDVEK